MDYWSRLLLALAWAYILCAHCKVVEAASLHDGYGPASVTMGNSFLALLNNNRTFQPAEAPFYRTPLDNLLVGTHRSKSADSFVTDSAAGATAFACGIKARNGAIGVDQNNATRGTVLEGAKENGLLTGVVVTTRITDATPGSFFAHVPSRKQESEIANEVFGLDTKGDKYRDPPLDLAIGGGGCYFFPKSDKRSCREDELNLVDIAESQGWNTKVLFNETDKSVERRSMDSCSGQHSHEIRSVASKTHSATKLIRRASLEPRQVSDLLDGDTQLPLLGLITPANLPYVIDRPDTVPSLPALAMKAIRTLHDSDKNDKGFFLVIEGSQIDLCGHDNDPSCHAREIQEYQETVDKVVEWVNERNNAGEETLFISTSDHETGGLDLARQDEDEDEALYAWYPEILVNVKKSADTLGEDLVEHSAQDPQPGEEESRTFIQDAILGEQGAGFTEQNGGKASEQEVTNVYECLQGDGDDEDKASACRIAIAKAISRRAKIGWSTGGHSAVDVNVYATGQGSQAFVGNHENSKLGHLVAEHLSINLAEVTSRLREQRGE